MPGLGVSIAHSKAARRTPVSSPPPPSPPPPSGPIDLRDGAPTLNQGGGSALIASPSEDALAFTGGSSGSSANATWTIEGATSQASYRIEYIASGQSAGCSPRFQLGGGNMVTGSGAAGPQSVTVTAGNSGSTLTVSFSPNFAGRNLTITGIAIYRALGALGVGNANEVQENSPIGTIVGAITGRVAGSALQLTDDAGGLFVIEGGNLVTAGPIDYDTATQHSIEIIETLVSAYGSPKATALNLNVVEDPGLVPLALGSPTVAFGSEPGNYTVGFSFRYPGSTLTLTEDAGGMFELVGAGDFRDLVNTAQISDAPDTVYNIEVTETAPGIENSPRATPLTVTVVAPGALADLSLLSPNTDEGQPIGSFVSPVEGKSPGSILTLTNDAGGRFATDGPNLVTGAVIEFADGPSHDIEITETLAHAPNSPKATVVTITINGS